MQRARVGGVLALVALSIGVPAARAVALEAPSTTTLSLSTAQSAYGQSVIATAAVSTVPGPAQGDVVFAIDGVQFSANLGATGTAAVVLPDAAVGQHAVSATFVPQFPTTQQPSTSPIQAWAVTQVRTRLQVRVIGKGARIPTSVQVKAAGEYGSLPTGRVKMVVTRVGTDDRTRVVRNLSSTAVAVAGLGRLRKGDYRLVVTYAGDTQHLPERHVERFHVRRR